MNLGAIRNGAILAGAAIGGGAAIGAGIGAVRSLNEQPSADARGLNQMERRSVLANMIIGAGAGAVGGAALIGARKLVTIPVLRSLPLPAMVGLGMATGAASYGAYTLGRTALN